MLFKKMGQVLFYKLNQAVYNRVILYAQLAVDIAMHSRLYLFVLHAWSYIYLLGSKAMYVKLKR